MQPINQETKTFLLWEYSWLLSITLTSQNESVATIEQNGWHMQKSQNCKLQQSTIGDMNQSLFGV
jgi:hypothetical protein